MAKKKNLSEALTFPVVKYLKAMVKLGRISQFCPEAGVMLTKKLQEDGYWCVIS
jgi:hypothetical protein